jgi:predicted Zn-dependent peptidase
MPDAQTHLVTLPNGVRVLTLRLPHRATVHVSVFVRSGSQHEARRANGIGHVIEHMAFKGTHTRSCQRINLDAERLGAEVNAHTDKDHTAFHIEGLAADAEAFVHMLGDIVLHSTFPEAELVREKQVILQELAEDEDDALAVAFRLFDQASWGAQPCAQPVIGRRRNIERFTRGELLAHVRRHYTGGNVVVAVAGDVDPRRICNAAAAALGAMPPGADAAPAKAGWLGGIRTRRVAGAGQTHMVLGFPLPSRREPHQAHVVAAALFGEGMSSPLLDHVRERLGLAYYVACAADVAEFGGQFVVEGSTAPAQAEAFLAEVRRLLAAQVRRTDSVALERARRQLVMRSLRDEERPARRLEAAVLDLYTQGQVRDPAAWRADVQAVSAAQVRAVFRQLADATPALAITGRVSAALKQHAQQLFGIAANLAAP